MPRLGCSCRSGNFITSRLFQPTSLSKPESISSEFSATWATVMLQAHSKQTILPRSISSTLNHDHRREHNGLMKLQISPRPIPPTQTSDYDLKYYPNSRPGPDPHGPADLVRTRVWRHKFPESEIQLAIIHQSCTYISLRQLRGVGWWDESLLSLTWDGPEFWKSFSS